MDNQPPVGIDHPRLTVLADLHRDRVPELLEADLGHADAGILPLAGEREPHVGLGLAAEIDRPVMDPVHGEFVISRSNGGCVQSCELPTSLMIHLLILAVHLLATIAKLVRPGGVRAVVAESLVLKQQLLISSRARRRAPNLNSFDRFLLGLGSLFVPPSRIPKLAVVLKPRTLFRFHEALEKRKYRWLFSSGGHRRPGPKGPSKELIDAIVEFKRRNPRVGCPRIAQEIAHAFGIDIDKDIVRRVLAKHYRPGAGIDGPSWLSFTMICRDA